MEDGVAEECSLVVGPRERVRAKRTLRNKQNHVHLEPFNTDSITLKNFDKHKKEFKISSKLGEWKIEKQGQITVDKINSFSYEK